MLEFLNNNAALLLQNPELAAAFQHIMKFQKYKKHDVLHEAGNICSHFYIVNSGIARVFYYKEDKILQYIFLRNKKVLLL